MPAPKKTLRTIPIAASSRSREKRRIPWMQSTPRTPVMVAPARSTGRDLASSPSEAAKRKASAMPGRVAWLRASVISERLRSKAKTPMIPAANPSRVVPEMTMVVLWPAWKVRVSMIWAMLGQSSVTSAIDEAPPAGLGWSRVSVDSLISRGSPTRFARRPRRLRRAG